MHCYTFWP